MESASLLALVETLILGCVLNKANSWVEAQRSRFKPALSATPNLALTSNLDSQFATLGFPFRSTFGFPFRSALGFPTLGLPRCYTERCLTLYVRNLALPHMRGRGRVLRGRLTIPLMPSVSYTYTLRAFKLPTFGHSSTRHSRILDHKRHRAYHTCKLYTSAVRDLRKSLRIT